MGIKELKTTDLPTTVKSYLDSKYSGWAFVKGVSGSVDNVVKFYHVVIEVANKSWKGNSKIEIITNSGNLEIESKNLSLNASYRY